MAQETFDDIPLHNLTTCQSIGDFTEAAVRSGHRDEALALVREREALARPTPSPWFHLRARTITNSWPLTPPS